MKPDEEDRLTLSGYDMPGTKWKLIIALDSERTKMVEAEKSFMEAEIKKLQKRFEAEKKYFSGMKAKERTDLVMQALDTWFAGKEAAYV